MKIEASPGSVRLHPAALSADATDLSPATPVWPRRLSFWGPILTATLGGLWLAATATAESQSILRYPLLALVALNLLYTALTGTPAVIGFVLHVLGRKLSADAAPSGLTRTALLMPIHKEDPRAVFAAIEAMARAIGDAGLRNVDLFILSDTQDARIAAEEQTAFDHLQARMPNGPVLKYRRRLNNAGRKAGNLADFCTRWGGSYDYMLVLDADSLMGAGTIARLIGLMDANPKTGIIQTVPYPVGRETLFARFQQFSARLYTPLLVEGLTFWQQSDGNYWGHNAIIRIAPFRAHCTLPVLPGKEPWGGEILCHDVVEAGLMRGAGWHVWVLPEVLESYEAVPANLVDFAARERRWCQGNLQHSGVVGRPGFRWVGRFHMAYGIAHYLAGPAAVLFLALATLDAVVGGGFAASLLGGSPASLGLIALTAALLWLGKVLCLGAVLADRAEARRYGGRLPLLVSAVLEQLGVFAFAAMLLVFYTRYMIELAAGRTVRWDAQPRDDRGLSWAEGWLRMRGQAAVGLAWLALLPLMPAAVWPWALPLLLGLLAILPLAVVSSRTSIGALARRWRLLLIPEELAPPPILRACQRSLPLPVVPERAPSAPRLGLVPQPAEGD